MGLAAEPQIHDTDAAHSQHEFARYEDFFDIKRGKKKEKIK
jgi:hypothetical protein